MGVIWTPELDKLIYEPNLLIPGEKPSGNVTTDNNLSTYWLLAHDAAIGLSDKKIVPTSTNIDAENNIVLDGSADYATIDNSDSFFTNGGNPFITFVHFISGGTQASSARILNCKSLWSATDGWSAEISNTSQIVLLVAGSTGHSIAVPSGLYTNGAEYKFVFHFDGTNMLVYCNGSYCGSTSGPVTINDSINDMSIGRYPPSGNYLKGTIKTVGFIPEQIYDSNDLSDDIYQLLKPTGQALIPTAAAGGTTSLLPARPRFPVPLLMM